VVAVAQRREPNMKSFKEYSQEVDEGFMGYQDSSMWTRHRRRVRGDDIMNQHFETEKGNFPERPYRGSYAKHEAKWEAHKEAKRQESLKGKGTIARKVSDVKTALHKKVYGFAPLVKEDAEGLDEGMYLVGTYTNPKKEHVRVWQHSPEGFHYSIENVTSKKTTTHKGSLDAAVKKHSLVLNKEEYEPAPNVPTHIRTFANKRRGQSYNVLGKTYKYKTKKDDQDHDDEGAIERAAARRKGLD